MTTATEEKKATARKPSRAKKARKPAARKKVEERDLAQEIQRPLWMAVGAVALAGDAVSHFLDDALKRGEKLEAKARKEIKSFTNGKSSPVERVRSAESKAKRSAKRETVKISDRVLKVFDMPTHKDILTLERKIDELAKRVA